MRFPGFEGEWVKVKLEDVTEKINSGKTPLGGQSTYLSEGIIFIRSQNVNNDQLELSSPIFISEEVNNGMKNSVVKPNDILLNITGASLGRSCVVPEDFKVGNVNQHVCIIRSKKDYTPRFIQPILSSAKGQAIFESLQTGSGREGLNFESIKKIELDFPTLDEQKRIADFLSLIDQRIQTQNKIIEVLATLMLRLRELIFNKKLRFKNRNQSHFPEWEEKKLGDSFDIIMGQSPDSRSYNKLNLGFPLIQGNADLQNRLSKPRNHTTQLTKESFAGDIILTVRAPVGAVAKSIHHACLGRGVCAIRPKIVDKCNIQFIYQFLVHYENHWGSIEQGSTFTSVAGSDIRNITIPFPSLPEQAKIAEFLSSLERKIEIEKELSEQYQNQKTRFLNDLFI